MASSGKRRPRHGRTDLAIACALALATFVVVLFAQRSMGIPRDESIYFDAAESYAAWFGDLAHHPGAALSDAGIARRFALNHEHAALPKILFGLSHAVFHDELHWTDHFLGFRLPALVFAALLAALTFLFGRLVTTRTASIFAAIAVVAIPRDFYHLNLACFDVPVTTAWVLTVYAYRRSLEPDAGRRWAILSGLFFGLAIAVKLNAYFLPPLLVLHWLVTRGRAAWATGSLRARLRAVPLAFPAMAILGPAVLLSTWPWMWHHLASRFAWYVGFHLHHVNYSWEYLGHVLRHPPFPIAYPFVVTALTVTVPILLAMTIGFFAAAWRLAVTSMPAAALARRRGRTPRSMPSQAREDLLLVVLNGLLPICLIALPEVPIFGGVKHWLPSMPFLFLLGGEVVALSVAALPLRRPRAQTLAAAATIALLVLPAATSAAHDHPDGTAAYNMLAGGPPGAASMGMQRQYWSNSVSAVLPWIDAHARPGASIYLHEVTYSAYRWYQRAGLLRPDLRWSETVAGADIATYLYHQEFRDREFEIWTDFGTTTPTIVHTLDDVPLAEVYARSRSVRPGR